MMELKNIYGDVIFALEGAKTVAELVVAAVAAKKSLSYSNLRYSGLRGSDLSSSDLRYSDLSSSDLRYSDLSYSNLSGSNLSGSNLSYSNLRGSNLSGSDLSSSNLRYSDLSSSYLRDAIIDGKKIHDMRAFSGLYRYQVWAVLFQDGSRWVRMGCFFYSLDEWEKIGIRNSNLKEFPNDGSDKCEERVRAFEFAKAAALALEAPKEAAHD